MTQIEYNRKPSAATLRAATVKAINAGETRIELIWGENQITIEKTPWGWLGHGWIGRNGGDDLIKKIEVAA